ncbi:MAG: C-terminal helicase domain-containing protein [Opitutaceae bacterium]|nr:C-terminal helicase domain-containing protein [Opitutaceae bacterium]
MTEGAKREVPKIKDLAAYRALLAPLVKRRVAQEPAVAAYVTIPVPTEEVITAEWDERHLKHYLTVAAEFHHWFMEAKAMAGQRRQNVNLIALLARIGAVEAALNTPEQGSKQVHAYTGGLTSKQRLAIERCVHHVADGHKVILFVRSPASAELFARQLRRRGIDCAVMHGGVSQKERTRALRDDFRLGQVPMLVATLGVAQTGLNIPEADRVIFYGRDWTSKTERQAKARVLRPQQKRPVLVEYLHLPGSLDDYMAQMVAFKGNAADAGLDWASPEFDDVEFLHLDTLLGRFCEQLAALPGCKPHELRERLAAAA